MPAYVLIDVEVTDPVRYKEYLRLADLALPGSGGRFLARGSAIDRLEGDWDPKRLVVIEFPDREAALRWHRSDGYQRARKERLGAARFSAVVVDGVPGPAAT